MESLEQALTDPENQPSQFGTVTLEWHKAELAKLLQHVEAMCRILQMGDGGFDRPETAAYRATYPKE